MTNSKPHLKNIRNNHVSRAGGKNEFFRPLNSRWGENLERKKIVILADTERESGAALALLLGRPDIEIAAIVASGGRVPVEIAFENTAKIALFLGEKIRILKGSPTPITADLWDLRKQWEPLPESWQIFGPLTDEIFPGCVNTDGFKPEYAAVWLVEALEKTEEPFTILSLGPLTDLALALRIAPAIADNIKEIIIAGGGHMYSDITAAAEYNIYHDPEAAAIVMALKTNKTLIPLDCTYSCMLTESEKKSVFSGNGIRAGLVRRLIGGYDRPLLSIMSACAAVYPEILAEAVPYSVYIDISGGFTDGQTVFDTRRIFDNYNCRTAFTADKELFIKTITELITLDPKVGIGRRREQN